MIHSADAVGEAFKGRLNHAVDGERFDAIFKVEAKQPHCPWRKIQVSEQVVTRSVGDLMLQEGGIHFSHSIFKISPKWQSVV